MGDLDRAIQDMLDEGKTPIQARTALVQKGFLEEEIDRALNETNRSKKNTEERKTNRLLATREAFDRLGYGFATPQFVNILFWQSGAGLFLIALFNGIKTILALLFSSILQEYCKYHTVPKKKIANAGLVYGFSFFLMAFATLAQLPWLFIIGFLLGAVGIVTYGDLYLHLVHSLIKHEKRSHFLKKAAFYGVLISAVSLLVSGVLIDAVPGKTINIANLFTLQIHGFLISFMITAFAFILGSYVLSMLPDKRERKERSLALFLKQHCTAVWIQGKVFLKNPYVFLLLLPAVLAGLLHILGASFYGIFIYRTFKDSLFGGFTNVAILYAVALIASLFGPYFTKLVQRSTGLTPHLVFGTLMTAILPFVLVKNPHYLAIMAALICSVIGGAITGTAQGLITQKIMDLTTRKSFFVTQAFLVAIPYIILVPLGAWFVSAFGLDALFMLIGYGLALVVAPLYFILVAVTSRMQL